MRETISFVFLKDELVTYSVWTEKMEWDEDAKLEGERIVHACNNHEPDSPEQGEGTTMGVLEGTYGPWIMVVREKNGTKIRRGSGLELGKTQGHHLKVHDVSVNEIRLGAEVGKTTFSSGSPREGKRKMSPIRVPTGLHYQKPYIIFLRIYLL
nr:hypothetical protein CFP56_18448 [Quercus suber]